MKKIALIISCLVLLSAWANADERFPAEGWMDQVDPIASPMAVVGGEISIFAGQYPKSFNYYLDNNAFTVEVFGAMFETLLTRNAFTLEYEPNLAEKCVVSEDKKTFTFYIDKNAEWSDGTPVSAHDVLWTFQAIMDPKNLTGVHKVSLEVFETPVVIDDYTIQFHAKDIHWRNLMAVSGFQIMSKKAYGDKDFNKINFEFPVISGLYRLGEIEEGIHITMERRKDWWKADRAGSKGIGNFQTLHFKFFAERQNAFEAFQKGLLDLFPIYTSRLWVNETTGENYINNWIVKQKIYNYQPVGFQGFAMNMRRPPFDDIRVRKAMAHLLDRRKMNKTLMYDQYFLHRSYYEDLYSDKNPCPNPLIEFDEDAAAKLLKEAGWKVNPDNGYLEKDGSRFTFRFLTRDSVASKFLAIYAEDLKDVGIEMVIDQKDWAAWAKDMDEFNYEMTWAAWSSVIFKDPEGMWSSWEAEKKSGNNITGFKNERVDTLIEKQKKIFDVNERNEICREIDEIISRAYPYVLLWNIDYTRLLYWNKFGTPDTVLSKYGDERAAYWYWWNDPDTAADLKVSMEGGYPMPPKEPEVRFDDYF